MSKEFLHRLRSGFGGFLKRFVLAQIKVFFVVANRRPPFPVWVPNYPNNTRLAVFLSAPILVVLFLRRFAQIANSVVGSNSVNVVKLGVGELSVSEKPRNAVPLIHFLANLKNNVSGGINCGYRPSVVPNIIFAVGDSNELPGLGVVTNVFLGFIGSKHKTLFGKVCNYCTMHENDLDDLRIAYVDAGGTVSTA